ncbi:MAG TPA: sortase [Patescibacteria group bacterium]|jgi:sortase A|nr:sortase [Patescibacteria group bacterium]
MDNQHSGQTPSHDPRGHSLNEPGHDTAIQIVRQQVQTAQDWQQYHTAWQQYYQQYYQRYYHNSYEQKQRLLLENAAQAAQPGLSDSNPISQTKQLKKDLLGTVNKRAKKIRKSNHFIPLASALLVCLLFMFLQYNRLWVASAKAYVSPGSTVSNTDTILVDPTMSSSVGPESKLIIPKLNIDVPVVYDLRSLDNKTVQDALTRGVVNYRLPGADSAPGQAGNTVILGHSSNDVFDPGDYKFAFVLLDRLEPGDIFYLHYSGQRYIYRVSDKKIINPNQLGALQVSTSKPVATLVTCTPVGTALQRLLVFADQISPDPSKIAASSSLSPSAQPQNLPGNSPTLLDRLFGR